MFRLRLLPLIVTLAIFPTGLTTAQSPSPSWTFAVSGDSRNCGDFVMPAIAAKV